MIKVSICLSDIDKEKITTSQSNGKKYLNLILDKRKEPGTYGETHTLYHDQTKEERQARADKKYVGNGKEIVFNQQPKAEDQSPAESLSQPGSDLPF